MLPGDPCPACLVGSNVPLDAPGISLCLATPRGGFPLKRQDSRVELVGVEPVDKSQDEGRLSARSLGSSACELIHGISTSTLQETHQ